MSVHIGLFKVTLPAMFSVGNAQCVLVLYKCQAVRNEEAIFVIKFYWTCKKPHITVCNY